MDQDREKARYGEPSKDPQADTGIGGGAVVASEPQPIEKPSESKAGFGTVASPPEGNFMDQDREKAGYEEPSMDPNAEAGGDREATVMSEPNPTSPPKDDSKTGFGVYAADSPKTGASK